MHKMLAFMNERFVTLLFHSVIKFLMQSFHVGIVTLFHIKSEVDYFSIDC